MAENMILFTLHYCAIDIEHIPRKRLLSASIMTSQIKWYTEERPKGVMSFC